MARDISNIDGILLGELRLPLVGSSASEARQFMGAALRAWEMGDLVAEAVLLGCELVTNAIRYAHVAPDAYLCVLLIRDGAFLRVEVHDPSRTLPHVADQHDDDLAQSGRGLRILAGFAADHGWQETAYGKCVWFTLRAE